MHIIDLHGWNKIEVWTNLEPLILNHFQKNIKIIKVIVGNGQIVKDEAIKIIENIKIIKKFEYAHPYDGGTGVIILYF